MKKTLYLFFLLIAFAISPAAAQEYYFPPLEGSDWETATIEELNWNAEAEEPLRHLLDSVDTKGFVLLKDGRIALEYYFGDFTRDSLWYWASAGKTLTAFLTGLAQEQGHLDIDAPTADYLGPGWTSLPPEREAAIAVRHQLTMTTGLDEDNFDCTDPECLDFLAEPGTRWAYHNAPYTLLQDVVAAATGETFNRYLANQLHRKIGTDGMFVKLDYKGVMFSTARSMARFGLLALNRGAWDGDTIMRDAAYFDAMTSRSQDLNPSYGYLWWLNGDAYLMPGVQFLFEEDLIPSAPKDLYAGLGKNDQKLYVSPELGVVCVRLGESAQEIPFLASSDFDEVLWRHLRELMKTPTARPETPGATGFQLFPNPASESVSVRLDESVAGPLRFQLADATGRIVISQESLAANGRETRLDLPETLPAGVYWLRVADEKGRTVGGGKIALLK